MPKLNKIEPRLQTLSHKIKTTNVAEHRITGRRLQKRRYRIWLSSPACADCGRVVEYPAGFELDHIVPLYQGGSDTDDNCQILCIDPNDPSGGCHASKTRRDMQR